MPVHARERGQKGSWGWLELASHVAADPVPLNSLSASGLLQAGQLVLRGMCAVNTATTAGTVTVLDGADAKGQPVLNIAVAVGATVNPSLPGNGILLDIGCFLVLTGVTLTGAVWVVNRWNYEWSPPGE